MLLVRGISYSILVLLFNSVKLVVFGIVSGDNFSFILMYMYR